ncbi:hypothetical protein ABZS81_19735 [Streptomyces sp. NPDC005318]|uniref:hypothetical protein n=1 Tax=Streptomyces sp. NPDC005318 TaxID=3157031 RepID=UPI0033A358D7
MRTTTLGTRGPEAGVIGLGAMGMSFAYDMATPRDDATSWRRHTNGRACDRWRRWSQALSLWVRATLGDAQGAPPGRLHGLARSRAARLLCPL